MDFGNLNNYIPKCIKMVKNSEDVGTIAPYLLRQPKIEECYALEFLKEFYNETYPDIEIHDLQTKNNDKLDLICRNLNLGIEVTQAINPKYREEEGNWNNALCKGKSSLLTHAVQNDVVTFEIIEEALKDKNNKYNSYIKNCNLKDCDLFVYIVDVPLYLHEGNFLKGFYMDRINNTAALSMGFPMLDDIAINGFLEMIKENKTQYRKIFFVFQSIKGF